MPKLRAIVLGPPGSGKSSFIGALQRSLIVDPSTVVHRCIYKGQESAGDSGGMGVERFYIELAHPPRAVELALHEGTDNVSPEGPAGQGRGSTWIAQARSAEILVLCVDAVAGQRGYWRTAVEQIVRDLTWLEVAPGEEHSEAVLQGLLPTLNPGSIHCLPFKRVLFLLSKIDLLFEKALAVKSGYGFLRLIAAKGPSQLRHALDPAPQLCSLLGTLTIGKVLCAVPEKAEVAVAATSSWGMGSIFDEVHRGEGGRTRCAEDGPPFGIKESLEFLVAGNCTSPVARLSRESLKAHRFMKIS